MMKKIFTTLTIIFTFAASAPVFSAGPEWGYVNGKKLILSHPLMMRFDPQTRSFKQTVSQPLPSENSEQYINRLKRSLAEVNSLISNLDAEYSGQIAGNGMYARKVYSLYWKKRESLRFYAKLLENAINQVKNQGDFYLNSPSEWKLMPVVEGISTTINQVCNLLMQKYDLKVVLDASVFKLKQQQSLPTKPMFNQHWEIWRGRPKAIKNIDLIASQLISSVRNDFPEIAHRPFVAGVKKLDTEALQMIKAISMPTSEIPNLQERQD
jgi:Skp family chaperone for outer membrane proteins